MKYAKLALKVAGILYTIQLVFVILGWQPSPAEVANAAFVGAAAGLFLLARSE